MFEWNAGIAFDGIVAYECSDCNMLFVMTLEFAEMLRSRIPASDIAEVFPENDFIVP